MIQLPGFFPPACQTSTLALDIGLQFLSKTRPLRIIAMDGFSSSSSGAIFLVSGGSTLNFEKLDNRFLHWMLGMFSKN